jgi:hypothetical protein
VFVGAGGVAVQTHKQQSPKQPSPWSNQDELAARPAKDVIEDHIRLLIAGQLEEDLHRNYATDAVLLTDAGAFRGHAGWRANTASLYRPVSGAFYEITALQAQDNYVLLVWKAGAADDRVDCAVDSFVVVDGKIRMQTSHARIDAI